MDQITRDLEWLRLNTVATDGSPVSLETDIAATHTDDGGGDDANGQDRDVERVKDGDGDTPRPLRTLQPMTLAQTSDLLALAQSPPLPSPPPHEQHLSRGTEALEAALTSSTIEAALHEAQADLLAARQAAQEADEARRLVSAQLVDAQQASEQYRLAVERLGRHVALYEADLHAVEAQTEALQTTVHELSRSVAQAWREKESLHATLTAAQEQLEAFDALKITYAETKAALDALHAQSAELTREQDELRQLVQIAQQTADDGAAYWDACRNEQAALRAALAVSEAANRAWENAFLRVPDSPTREDDACGGGTAHGRVSTAEDVTAQPVYAPESPRAASLVAVLEAKVVDLALALHNATQQAAIDSAEHAQLAASVLLDASLLTSYQAQLAVARPMAASVANECVALRAACAATEARHAALLDTHETLLEDYTQEALHTHALERELVRLTRLPAPHTPSVRTRPNLADVVRAGEQRKRPRF